MTPGALTAALKEEAFRLGFDLAGATPAQPAPGLARFRQWLADGFAGQMAYLSALSDAREHPRHVLPGVESILMLAMVYRSVEPVTPGAGQGTIARYAWGLDYHAVVRRGLRRLAGLHRRLAPAATVRGVVDTAPLLERELAQLAGLGSIGKNTLLVNRRLGSWLVLAALLSLRAAPVRPAGRSQLLRQLPGVPRGVPHRGPGRALPARRPEVHLLPDHRVARPAAVCRPPGHGPPPVRLRRLPGGVPLEPGHPGQPEAGVPAAAGPEPGRP